MAAIICIGNRFIEGDDIGPRVYHYLAGQGLPQGVSLIDGGLMDLNLLRYVEGASRVVFVDTLEGFAPAGQPATLDHSSALASQSVSFGHSSGLAFLLRMLPALYGNDLPQIAIVGAEPPIHDDIIGQLADEALNIATGKKHERERNRTTDPAQPGIA